MRFITGKLQARELKLPFSCNVMKCPIKTDKSKIEFPCLPEGEQSEVVIQVTNESQKPYMIETVPPNMHISGIIVNPLVSELGPGKSTLVSVKYTS